MFSKEEKQTSLHDTEKRYNKNPKVGKPLSSVLIYVFFLNPSSDKF